MEKSDSSKKPSPTQLPSVAVIIPNYNCGHLIQDAIDSIANQTYKGEIFTLIIDDASTKNEFIVDTGKTLETDKSFPFVKKAVVDKHTAYMWGSKNNGPSWCRNYLAKFAIERLKCKYLAFLDADDIYHVQKIKKSVEVMEQDENIAAVYSDYTSLNMKTGVETREYKPGFDKHYLLRECIVNNDSVVRAQAFQAVGGYDEEMRCAEDYDMWIRISQKWLIYHIPEDLVTVRVTGEGATFSRTTEEWQRNWNRIREKLNAAAAVR